MKERDHFGQPKQQWSDFVEGDWEKAGIRERGCNGQGDLKAKNCPPMTTVVNHFVAVVTIV